MVSNLRWEKNNWAYSGQLVVGMVGRRADGSIWYTANSAVDMRYIAKGRGEVKSIKSAKRAVEHAWARWLEVADLRRK